MIRQGDVYWADLAEPTGSEDGHRRPVVVVQRDALNGTELGTVVVVPLTANLKWREALGNVLLPAESTGLPKDAVAQCCLVAALDRSLLQERAGRVERGDLVRLIAGIHLVLGA